QAKELRDRNIAATRTANGILVQLKDELLFDTGSDVLKPDAVENLDSLGDLLTKYPDEKIEVVGFTDSTGTVTFNQELSMRRAEAVRKVLVERGVSEQRALAIGMGPEQPVASNQTPAGRATNRRAALRNGMA